MSGRLTKTRQKKSPSRKKATRQSAAQFFYVHAGYACDSGKETTEQGRRRGAKSLARAEAEAAYRGWHVEWEYDSEPYEGEDPAPDEVLRAVLRSSDGEMLGVLGGIPDPDRSRRRVVEAELAQEALGASHDRSRR